MNEEMRTRTYEELLINRVAKAFESMDNVNAEFFDEILDELVMLFKLKPDMYEQLQKWKQYHETVYQQNLELSKQKVLLLEDEIAQDITMKYYQTKIDWSYRKDMLETMINILNEYKLIPFTNPEYAEIEPIEPAEPPKSQEQEQPKQPPTPPPQQEEPVPMEAVEEPYQPPVQSPVMQPTNLPQHPSNPPQQLLEPDDELQREAERLAREEEEIMKASMEPLQLQPQQQPKKKGLGLFKKM